MFKKLLNDSGFLFLIHKKKYGELLKLIALYGVDKVKKSSQKHIDKIDKIDLSFENLINITNLHLKNEKQALYQIQLVGLEVNLSDTIFDYEFKDQESLFSVYRFRWLLIGLEHYQDYGFVKASIHVINKWIENFEVSGKKINETYSICERLLNILYFILVVKKNDASLLNELKVKKLEQIYKVQILDILNNIEDRGKYTNNHIINNARALYILGGVFQNNDLIQRAKKILDTHLHNHIKEGVLLEGSFHYQVLLTRTILEMYHIALKIDDEEMMRVLRPYVVQMLSVTQSLHSDFSDKYPVIGDISPDFPIEFFQGYPFSKSQQNSPWNNLFHINFTDIDFTFKSQYQYWEKYIFDAIEIWIVKKNNGLLPHGHNDNGSFHIFYQGQPILIDIGRFTYERNTMYDFMLLQSMHNGIANDIDLGRSSVFFGYFNKISSVKVKKNKNQIDVVLVDCFNEKEFSYSLSIGEKSITIQSKTMLQLFFSTIDTIKQNSIEVGDLKIIVKNKKIVLDNILCANNYGDIVLAQKVIGMNDE